MGGETGPDRVPLSSRLGTTPERELIFLELHARPYHPFQGPAHVLHLAFLTDDTREPSDRAEREELTAGLGLVPSIETTRHGIWSAEVAGRGLLTLVWERHHEYCAYSFFLTRLAEPFVPFGLDERDLVPAAWLQALSPRLLVATRVAVGGPADVDTGPEALAAHFEGHPANGCSIMGGRGLYFTCFRLHSQGMGRVVLVTGGMSVDEVGRSVQRVLEIEDLYHLTLLPIPASREIRPLLVGLEERFDAEMTRLSVARGTVEERESLEGLLKLAADVEHLHARVSFRFPASVTYLSMLDQRIAELREAKLEHVLTPSRFVMRRVRPAVETFQHVLGRITDVSERVSRAAGLMRTRIELSMEEQNQQLLASVDRRAHLQVRLQETVEGLSVIVLSYYSVGLISYVLKGLKGLGVGLNADAVTGLMAPLLVAAVWLLVRRLKGRIDAGGHGP